MICSKDISSIKMELNKNIGQKIILKGTLGRNKAFEKEAVIDGKEYNPLIPVLSKTKF